MYQRYLRAIRWRARVSLSWAKRRMVLRKRLKHRVATDELLAALETAIPTHCDTLLVHSSLSACGYIPEGPEFVIDRIMEKCDTVCFVTHSYCYPRHNVAPVFDIKATPSRVGRISEVFRVRSGVTRSLHPTHSIAAIGARAAFLCAGHEACRTPCGQGTPYAKLLDSRAAVLMFGANMGSYTLFHTVEDAANVTYLYEPTPYDLLARDAEGRVHRVSMYRHDMSVPRRFAEMDTSLEQVGLLTRVELGCGELLCVPDCYATHRFLLEKLQEDPGLLVKR